MLTVLMDTNVTQELMCVRPASVRIILTVRDMMKFVMLTIATASSVAETVVVLTDVVKVLNERRNALH